MMIHNPIQQNIVSIATKCRALLGEFKFEAAGIAHDVVIGQLNDNLGNLSVEFILDMLALIADEPVLISNRNHGFSLIKYSRSEAEDDRTEFVGYVRNDDWHLEIRDAIKAYLSTAKLLDK